MTTFVMALVACGIMALAVVGVWVRQHVTIAKLRRDNVELTEKYRGLATANEKLHLLLRADAICMDEKADARKCPMYDESEPYRCARERVKREAGVE